MIGQGERVQALGPCEKHQCPRCEEERDFTPQIRYSYGQFDLLFGFVYNRRYQLACSECNHGWILQPHAARELYGKPAIPFHLRYGLLVLGALAGVVGAAVYFYGHAT